MKSRQFISVAAIALLLSGCTSKNNQGQTQLPEQGNLLPDTEFFMFQSQSLPQSVDTNQDISNLSYQQLRLLRNYVYAIHGHWIMEGDVNRFFAANTDWYENLCYNIVEGTNEGLSPEEAAWQSEYATALWEDYGKAVSMIKLTDEEKSFVASIDQRMAELMSKKNYTNAEGTELLNPNLAVNWFQIENRSEEMNRRILESNVNFTTSNVEQLFNIYEQNEYSMMPNFITTDLMLQAYHMYFNYVLASLERHTFSEKFTTVFTDLLKKNAEEMARPTDDIERINMEMKTAAFASVALRLLNVNVQIPEQIEEICNTEIKNVLKAEDCPSPLFETALNFNYSLFRPRGRYTRTEQDKQYFRAMMWMQKGCFFREKRDQLRQAIYIAYLINNLPASSQTELNQLNQSISFLMGEPDNYSIIEVANKLKELKVTSLDAALSAATTDCIDDWLKEGFKGRNQISPKVVLGPQDQLNLMPQRYNVDGDILGELFDPNANAKRAYPMGLDIFSLFGSEAATQLLDTCYHTAKIWPEYNKTFAEVQKNLKDFSDWDKTFYNKWLDDLIALQKPFKEQPGFMQTSTWQLKNLNTGLASWALLKHDAILYAEQPMAAECGGGGLPDPKQIGYVEPNVPFWKKLQETVKLNRSMLEKNGLMTDLIRTRTDQLQEYIDFCLRVSEAELANAPISEEDYSTIMHIGSSIEYFTLSVLDPDKEIYEWGLVEGADRKVAQVADVFTRNILGCEKDGILYEATGTPYAIYVLVEIDGKCYLTRGATYSYYEFVRPLDQPRLTDEEWQKMIEEGQAPATTEWFAPLLNDTPCSTSERYVYSTGC